LYINDTPKATGVNVGIFADDVYLYSIERKEGNVLRNLQRGLDAMAAWCKRWKKRPHQSASPIKLDHL
jgi:hypothetical protein